MKWANSQNAYGFGYYSNGLRCWLDTALWRSEGTLVNVSIPKLVDLVANRERIQGGSVQEPIDALAGVSPTVINPVLKGGVSARRNR